MFTLPASLALALLQLFGFSEGFAGRFVASVVFRPLLILLAAGGTYVGVVYGLPAMVRAHDAHVAARATETFKLRLKNEELAAKARAEEEARLQTDQTLRAREGDLTALRTVVSQLEKEKTDARRNSPDPDQLVVPAGDPWLRAGPR